jgi:hypothetical protein
LGVTALQKLSFQSLVLTRACSVEVAARRYGCSSRAVRRWCWTSPRRRRRHARLPEGDISQGQPGQPGQPGEDD